MSEQRSILQPIDVNNTEMERSPARKRARLESPNENANSNTKSGRFSLSRSVKLDVVFDFGISVLDTDSDTLSDEEFQRTKAVSPVISNSVESSSTEKLSNENWDNFLVKKSDSLANAIDYFSLLSDEVILQIFYFLPKKQLMLIASVCQRFYRLSNDESLWTRMNISNRVLYPGALGKILDKQVVILRLAQSDIQTPAIDPTSRSYGMFFFSRLRYLDLSMVHIHDDDLMVCLSKCVSLKKISLEHVAVSQNSMGVLARNTQLEVINLALVQGLDLKSLTYLLTNCRKIRELNIAWTNLSVQCVKYVCSHLPATLDRLNISGFRKSLTDENVADLVAGCPGLRELDLSDSTSITGNAIQHIVKLKDLNFLALSRCYLIPSGALLNLKKIPSLMYLEIHGGYVEYADLEAIQAELGSNVLINKFKFSSVARPTVGARRSRIWNLRVRD